MAQSYPNLPGMMTEFQDGGLQLREQQVAASTGSILILGTATDGPVMEPVAIDSRTVESVFGRSVYQNGRPNGATLPEAFNQAYNAGCRDIRMMRISGKPATAKIMTAAVNEPVKKIDRPQFGAIGGNEDNVFVLKHENVINASIIVLAGGKTLSSSKYTFDEETNAVTVLAGSCSVGVDISIKYEYYAVESVEAERFVVEEGQTEFTLANTPIVNENFVIRLNDADLNIPDYTLEGKTLTVLTAIQLDEIEVDYDFVGTNMETSTENTDGEGAQWIASSGAKQEFEITKTPLPGTFKLYVDGREIIPSAAWNLDLAGTPAKLLIDKAYFQMGSNVEASFYYEEANLYTPEIVLETYFGGTVYNECQKEIVSITGTDNSVVGKKLIITKPLSKRSAQDEAPREYSSLSYPTFGQLIGAINSDFGNGIVRAFTDFPDVLTEDLLVSAKASFTNGDDGLNLTNEEIFKLLAGVRNSEGLLTEYGAFQLLENYRADFVVVKGVYADDELVDKYANFTQELATYCAIASQTHMTHGVIALRPPVRTGLANIEEHVKKLEKFDNNFFMRQTDGTVLTDREGKPFDVGRYITVIAGPEQTFTSSRLGVYNDDGDVLYAAINTALKASSAPTNKRAAGAAGLRFAYGEKQLQRLLGNRLVTFNVRGLDGAVVITDGVTSAQPGSDYSRIVNIKVVRQCLDDVFAAANPYIGEPPTAANNNALISAISKKLDIRMEGGDVSDYSLQLVSDPLDKLIGDSKLELAIVPPGERRRITVVTGLKKSL